MSLTGRKVLAIIITKDIVEPACMESVLKQDYPDYDIMIHVAKAVKYINYPDKPKEESYVNQYINCAENRNKARRLALASDADYFMWVDSDTVIPNYTISRLMLNKKDAVGGYYKMSGNNPMYVCGREWINSHGHQVFVHNFRVEEGLQPVDTIGMGCALISRKLLEQVDFEDGLDIPKLQANYEHPWQYSPVKIMQLADGREMELHPCLEQPRAGVAGECSAFGIRAREKGFRLFMDGSVEVIEHLTREGHYTTLNNQPTEQKDETSNS